MFCNRISERDEAGPAIAETVPEVSQGDLADKEGLVRSVERWIRCEDDSESGRLYQEMTRHMGDDRYWDSVRAVIIGSYVQDDSW